MSGKEAWVTLIGRFFLALIFFLSGLNKIFNWEGTAQYMASKGMPLVPVFLLGAILVEVLGGLAVIVGFRAKLAAWLLFLFLIPVTLIFHNFWALEGMERQMQFINFMKNLSIMGGLLLLAAYGPGPKSLDARKAESHGS